MRKLILVGREYVIEPLGILYLAGLALKRGWDVRVILVKDFDFAPLYAAMHDFKPNIVGFSIWTGYHVQAFEACDVVRQMGAAVVIGGPHATYFTAECQDHADWVIKAEGFRMFRRILDGTLPQGTHFDEVRMAEGFPMPARALVYEAYPVLAENPIKSIFCSIGCPFHCSYCYAPTYNAIYGGFQLNLRPVDEIIKEARELREGWPVSMIYFQDDIFGFNLLWLREFAERWPREVGLPWHCQIRLELTRQTERLELFSKGGCTGITLAIESGNDFLREFVLLRPMEEALIIEGCRKIRAHGMTLRTEQILAVPFSNIGTDLETLRLNIDLRPEMAWTSILAPYGGTNMGAIAKNFGFYAGNNDDLSETFFDRSVLHHAEGGRISVEDVVRDLAERSRENPLLHMRAHPVRERDARVFYKGEREWPV